MTYQEKKEKVRQKAIKWQIDFENQNYTWADLVDYSYYFYKMGKRYGLLKEFRENGIC